MTVTSTRIRFEQCGRHNHSCLQTHPTSLHALVMFPHVRGRTNNHPFLFKEAFMAGNPLFRSAIRVRVLGNMTTDVVAFDDGNR